MNIYDFDGTIYNGDSNRDIILFGLKRFPKKVLKSLNNARKLNHKYKKGIIPFERVKEAMLSFIFEIDDTKMFINDFVTSHMNKIKSWYLNQKKESDVILSASYDLWIKEFAKLLNVANVVSTHVNSNGKIIGSNCKSENKVKMLRKVFPKEKILNAYGNEESDKYILQEAKNAFMVKGNKITKYN